MIALRTVIGDVMLSSYFLPDLLLIFMHLIACADVDEQACQHVRCRRFQFRTSSAVNEWYSALAS